MAVSSRFLLGRYEVGPLLGSGGTAEVFEGFDRVLARRVAIKVLYSRFARDPQFVERFKREARAAASLTHPNVVGVYDTGEQAGTHFIVMEFVEGRSLAEILAQDGKLAPDRAARLLVDVSAALGAAHARGLIHRDVKPANVMVTPRDQVKVMDFGIARAAAAAALTESAHVVGTAKYMAPEQAQAKEVDGRTDIYALGVCLYECLTGQVPFVGDSPVAVATRHVTEDPRPPRELDPDIPETFEQITLRAMAKDPAKRYQTAAEVGEDLQRAAAGRALKPVAAAARPPRRAPAVPLPASAAAPAEPVAEPVARPAVTETSPEPLPRYEEPEEPAGPWWRRRIAAAAAVALGLVVLAALAGFALSRDRQGDLDGGGIGQAPAVLVVPYVSRYPAGAARVLLTQKGFTVAESLRRVPDQRIRKGSVIRTEPPAGTEIPAGEPVTLIVSTGPQGVEVPLVLGQQVSDAQRYLASLGYRVVITRSAASQERAGTVIAQNPKEGTVVRVPGRIVLTIAGQAPADPGPLAVPLPTTPSSPPSTVSPSTVPPSTVPPSTVPPSTVPPTTL
jgi:eukaryotic-like serine/threonine-protein kinase